MGWPFISHEKVASMSTKVTPKSKTGGVQSVERALEIVELVGAAGGSMALVELAEASGLPMPTIHRLVRTLVGRSYLRQLPNRRYALGARLIPLGNSALEVFGAGCAPHLRSVVEALGETVSLATLDGDMLVYVGQVPSPHAMRMFTELGKHVHPHCRAGGKALLAGMPDDDVRELLSRTGMPARTPNTVTDPDALIIELAEIRRTGRALEVEEMEIGVQCIAVPVPSNDVQLALSMSAPSARMNDEVRERAVRLMRTTAVEVAHDLARQASA